ncbi:MAG: hypothetical protein HN336_10485 [Lentimicrobiaceae bacterium]|jgi:hypothetical protein|nr:hypothetical protein [Lentimicrobiaceae bacterium]MBT3454272.1 hypothetical protein [Lentimicrobiaceae bacterium]MBT3819588.1 hypothetical protein [Lentimicrobiaceae bacterium]MBT4189764.1 hypothetical protein [Lentimicrobiaceae bacterium]MBT4801504.1 hypothetical protein [Lentimicrobiaceae bacterium]
MATYYGKCRSNYFKIKDVTRFKDICEDFELDVIEKDNKFGFIVDNETGIPDPVECVNEMLEYDKYDCKYDYVEDIIAEMLDDNEVMIVMSFGSEDWRSLSGYAVAYNNKGETENVALRDIYEKSNKLGANITYAEW